MKAHADYIDHDGEIIFPDIGNELVFRLSDESHNCSIFDVPEFLNTTRNVTEEATTVSQPTVITTATSVVVTAESVTGVDAAAAQTTNANSGKRKTSDLLIFGLLATHITLTLC